MSWRTLPAGNMALTCVTAGTKISWPKHPDEDFHAPGDGWAGDDMVEHRGNENNIGAVDIAPGEGAAAIITELATRSIFV